MKLWKILKPLSIMSMLTMALSPAQSAVVGASYVFGTMSALTTTPSGIMIMIEGGQVSTNCQSGLAWLLIDKSNEAMTSAVLTTWFSGGSRYLYVYVNATAAQGGFCTVNQVQLP